MPLFGRVCVLDLCQALAPSAGKSVFCISTHDADLYCRHSYCHSILPFSGGIMLVIQGIHTLEVFGAQTQVVLGITLSVVREFGPLITGILVADEQGQRCQHALVRCGFTEGGHPSCHGC